MKDNDFDDLIKSRLENISSTSNISEKAMWNAISKGVATKPFIYTLISKPIVFTSIISAIIMSSIVFYPKIFKTKNTKNIQNTTPINNPDSIVSDTIKERFTTDTLIPKNEIKKLNGVQPQKTELVKNIENKSNDNFKEPTEVKTETPIQTVEENKNIEVERKTQVIQKQIIVKDTIVKIKRMRR